MALAYWLIPIALVLLHFLSDFTRKTLKRLPPGPTPLPIVGNMFSMVDLPHLTFMKLAKKYGPVMSFRIGVNTFVILTSPVLAREAFQTKDKALSDRWAPDYVHAFNHKELSMMFLNSSSPLFKQLRGVGANLVAPRNLDSSRFGREAKMLDLVTYFRNHAGKPLRISFPVFTNMINVISAVLFSEDMVDLNSDSIQEFRDLVMAQIVDPAAPNLTYLFPILRPLDLHGARAFGQKLYTQYYAFFDEIINRRRKVESTDDSRPKDFLDYLLELHAENKLELRVIKAFFSDVFGAGAHTSSVVFEWAMAELLHNPDKLEKVLAELKANVGTRQVEETDLMNLPYLQAVVKETMRKHPVAPLLLPHVVSESGVELGGYSIPKGSQVMVNVYALARDPKIWPEPEVFRPERFLENKMDVRGQNFELIPFGSGRRTCPGVPLVLRMLPLFLATLFQAFEWRLPDGMKPSEMDMTEKFEAAVALNTPLVAIPVPISGLDY